MQQLGTDIECDMLPSERGPSCYAMNLLNERKVPHVKFLPRRRRVIETKCIDSGTSVNFSDSLPISKSSQRNRFSENSFHHTEPKSIRIGTISMNPILKRGCGTPPCSLAVSEMLTLGKLRAETCITFIDVFEFNMSLSA